MRKTINAAFMVYHAAAAAAAAIVPIKIVHPTL